MDPGWTGRGPGFADDEPIDRPEQDALDYSRIAERFAHAIVRFTPRRSFVIAVNGGWGTGKSSFANLVDFYLASFAPHERPISIRYNPWLFQNPEQLTRAFFLTILFGIRPLSRRRRAISRAIIDIIGLVIGTASASQTNPFERMFRGEASFEMDKLKGEIESILESAGRRVLVMIDDIDRLSAAEIRKLFALLKTVGSLPYVTYFLTFDKAIVIRSLSTENGIRGNDYLEKIVQFSFDLPIPDDHRLGELLIQTVNTNCAIRITPEDFTTTGVDALYGGILRYIDTLRNLYRLSNVVTFTWALVSERADPVDFLVLETLRVFEPGAFAIIRDYPDSFVGRTGAAEPRSAADAETDANFHDEWLGKLELDTRMRRALETMLGAVFPRFRSAFAEGPATGESEPTSRSGNRLGDPDVLAFVLSLPLE